ncbi:hypothetical protein HUU05_00625 [candidate division KSB1 bacterium]|nr:hypothetical protein [candidate division KSB1 bacterium]
MNFESLNETQLHHLDTVTDPVAMAARFATYVNELAPDCTVENCAIEKIYYRATQSCTVLYRVVMKNGADTQLQQWFFGKVFPHKRARKRFDEIATQSGAAHALEIPHEPAWPPFSFWPDLDMVVWSFPHDPKMDWLARMVDLEFIQTTINSAPADFGLTSGWRVETVHFDRVKYMPGKRCVLRYHVDFNGPQGEKCRRTFYSKTYHDAKSRYHFEVLRAAYEHSRTQASFMQIPRPIRHLEEVNTFWQEEWRGHALIDALPNLDWQKLFPRLAIALADLHRSTMPGLRNGPDLSDALKTAADDAAELMLLAPHLREAISAWIDLLSAQQTALAQQTLPSATTHGAIRVEQMLIREQELALIDFDALALGDPLSDVAEFIASLQFLELSHGWPRVSLAAAQELFAATYAEHVPWPCDRKRLAWYALAFLISKMFLAVKNLDRRALQQLESAGMIIGDNWAACLME